MSYQGQSPKVNRLRLKAQSADPVNPVNGDFFYSDGTSRDAGLWVYLNSAWSLVSTSGAVATLSKLTFTPQSSDPVSPVEGMVFYADGTSRDEGLWVYKNSAWQSVNGEGVKQYYYKDAVQVRLATFTGQNLNATGVPGSFTIGTTIDGIATVTGDVVLLKNQTTASENGVYVVTGTNPSGYLARSSLANTADKCNRFVAEVTEGNTYTNYRFYQQNELTSLTDSQSWSTTITVPQTFIVPTDVTELEIFACGGGGAGGAGAGIPNGSSVGLGGNGGSAAGPLIIKIPVTAGNSVSIIVGAGGQPGRNGLVGVAGDSGGAGQSTTITIGSKVYEFPGASGGTGGAISSSVTSGGVTQVYLAQFPQFGGGRGGLGGVSPVAPTDGSTSIYSTSGAKGVVTNSSNPSRNGGPGGGGAGGYTGIGGTGGTNGAGNFSNAPAGSVGSGASGYGCGGGGGGGSAFQSGYSGVTRTGGAGSAGYVKIKW